MPDCTRISYFLPRCVMLAVCFMVVSLSYAQAPACDTTNCADDTVVTRPLSPAVIARYPYGVTFLRPEQLDSVLDYADTELVPIVFRRDRTDLHLPNTSLDSIVRVVNRILDDKDVHLAYVWIGGSASPEGTEARNAWLGKSRAKRLCDYLKAHTSLSDSLIRMENLAEDWRTPLKLIRQTDFPHKERVLEIWERQPDHRKRKREIRAIDNGATWEYLIDKSFRPARNARMVIVCAAEDSIATYRPCRRSLRVSVDMPAASFQTAIPVYRSRFVAVKTNLAALGLLVANLGVEFSFGNGFSLDLPFYYSPYDITSKFRVRVLGTQPELRYWLRRNDPGTGHFFGLNGIVAGFDISFPDSHRFQDPEHALWGTGLSYGYALDFGTGRHWGLEFNIGAGYLNYHLDTFENIRNGQLLHTRKKDYWGINRVGISLTYKFRRQKLAGFELRAKEAMP